MKRLTTLFLMGLLFILSSAIAQASPANVSLANAFFADQMPIGADLYMAIRTDDAYLDELDGILRKIVMQAVETIPNATIPEEGFGVRELINQVLASTRLDVDFETDIRPWLGSSMALGVYWGEDVVQDIFIAIDHSNRELVEAFIINTSNRQTEVTVSGNFSIYSINSTTLIGVNDDAIYIAMRPEILPIDGPPSDSLSNDPNFQKAVGALPSANYNILVAGDTSILAQMMDGNRISTRQNIEAMLPDAYTALGATIANGVSPTIDFAQVGLTPEVVNLINTPIDPSFTQHIPANATGVIHGTNLVAPYNALIDLLSAQTGQDMRSQLDQAYTMFGFDVINVLFSGDFAMYFTYKSEGLETIINAQLEALNTETSTTTKITDILEFGYVFEISDATQAQSLIDQLYNLYNMMGANTGISVSQEEIGGNPALVLLAEQSGMDALELVIGANDAVMVMGTRESATAVLTGNGRFDSNPFYQNSLRYSLPSMTHYWFIDRNSLPAMSTISTVLLGPAIGTVFDNVINNLGTSTPTPEEIARQEALRIERERQMLQSVLDTQTQIQAFSQIFDNATLSVSSKEGILFLRAVITLTE